MDKLSQHSKILKILKANPKGVENWRFTRLGILNYTGRISELRKDGFRIVAERVYANGRWTGTYKYFLRDNKPKFIERIRGKLNA